MTAIKPEEMIPLLKRIGILAAWFGGMFLVVILAWVLTGPLQSRALLRSANQALESSGKSIRLAAALNAGNNLNQRESWFSISNSNNRAVVFSILDGAHTAPFLGVLSAEGKGMITLIPLSINAERIMDRLPEESILIQTRRIEDAYRLIVEAEQ